MAAQEFSFDVVSKADMMEVRNAVDQAQKELANRYDFRGSIASIELEKDAVKLVAEDEFRLGQMMDILDSKFVKRGVDLRLIERGKVEPGAGISVRQELTFQGGLPQEKAKEIVKQLKGTGLKVQGQLQGDAIRVSGKVKDDLQKAITWLKGQDFGVPLQFLNFR